MAAHGRSEGDLVTANDRPILDYRIGGPLDPRNKNFRVSAAPTDLLQRSRYWLPGPVLDQGSEGSCVGHGVVAEFAASPVRGNLGWYWVEEDVYPGSDQPHVAHPGTPAEIGHYLAVNVYRRAQQIDEWAGENYSGTSVLAGMKVGQERGWWSGYSWALNMAELRAALEMGPVVIGVEWREQMYRAPSGIVTVGGQVVGGHCLVLTGYTPRHRVLKAPAYRWRNSWGGGSNGYGINGSAYIAADDLDAILFRAGGEAAIPTGRAA
jgi:hypothetical protein